MRPLLVPGAHVLRRRDGSFQVGLDPRGAIVLPDTPAVASCLTRLDGSRTRPADEAAAAVLDEAGLLVDERAVSALLAGDDGPATGRAASLLRRHGTRAPDVVAARSRRAIGLVGFGDPSGAELSERLRGLLDEALLTCDADEPAIGLLVGLGEPDRELARRLDARPGPAPAGPAGRGARDGRPVRRTRGRRRACAAWTRTTPMPTRPGRCWCASTPRPAAGRVATGSPSRSTRCWPTVAAGWAARDLATYVDGGRPSTWSTTLTLDADLTAVETRTWSRHPECGCSWQ